MKSLDAKDLSSEFGQRTNIGRLHIKHTHEFSDENYYNFNDDFSGSL